MSLKKLSLEKETLTSLDSQESMEIAGGATYRCNRTWDPDYCETRVGCGTRLACGTGTCATNCGTCATCNTCATNCGTCGTCATACGQATCDCLTDVCYFTDACSTQERSCLC